MTQLNAELEVVTSPEAERPPREQVAAAKAAASESALSLEAGARAVKAKVEAEGEAPRFDNRG